MKTYSIIWDGSEDGISQQIDYVTKWARANAVAVKYWRDKTIQSRVCQYVGNPKSKTNWQSYMKGLVKKYTILQMSESQLERFKQLVGKSFTYETKEQQNYMVVDAFTIIKDAELLAKDYNFKNTEHKFNTEEEMKVFANQTALAKNQTRDLEKQRRYLMDGYTRPTYDVYEETITTTHKAKLKPWVILDDESLEKAGIAISTTADVDTAPLLAREEELIDAYNNYNNACGRVRWIREDKETQYDLEVVKAYKAREAAGRELVAVRKSLGAAKRKLTLASKREGGIEYDLKPLSLI